MSEPRIILLCGNRLALPTLQELLFFKRLVAIVIPEPCEEMIGQVQVMLQGMDIPVVIVNKENSDKKIRSVIGEHTADTGLIISFSYKISPAVYTLLSRGFYNVHPGPLPAYRGPDPVFRQIKNKEKNAGITIHKLDDGFDTGPVVISEMIRLDPADTYGILIEKLSHTTAGMVRTLIKLLGFGVNIPSKAQDASKAVYYKKQVAADITIDWAQMDAATIVALVNACNPWNKGAITKLNTKIIRLLEATIDNGFTHTTILPGTILAINEKGVAIAAADQQAVLIKMICIDEGFLMANRLAQFGVLAGSRLG